jgi:PhzF family phenazine biosynthesis protein
MKIMVRILNGFIDNGKGGNPAGLVLDADNLSDQQKQSIAAKAGLSETAFVSHSNVADYKFDFFTPTKQIPHCGHATIAAFSYLQQNGMLKSEFSSKETIDGTRKIIIRNDNAFMEQKAPVYTLVEDDKRKILTSLGLQQEQLIDTIEPMLVNTGNTFLVIGVKNKEIVGSIHYDHDDVYSICEKYNLVGFYPFALDTVIPGRDATTRMFGPYYGIAEESATGMAAGPLACYLYDQLGYRKKEFIIEQGHFMNIPSPSLIIVNIDIISDSISGLMAGGKGNTVKTLEIEI